jgi:hypothetical protein
VPNWQPNWQDVRWDFAAAERAATELDRAADLLDRTSATRAQASQRATAQWFGVFRTQFDSLVAATLSTAHFLAGAFRDAALRIRRASVQAFEEQQRRVADRKRWQAEKAKEDAAAAAKAHH